MPGPVPKSPYGRRKGGAPPTGVVHLPASGRKGPAPAWPLSDRDGGVGARERALWAELWATPQAVAWEPMGAGTAWIVALYCRLSIECESLDAPASLLAELRQIGDRFGLNPTSLARLRWLVVDEGQGATAGRPALRAIDGDAGRGRPRAVHAVDDSA